MTNFRWNRFALALWGLLQCQALADPLVMYANATNLPHSGNDGDSFLVQLDKGEPEMLRLYFADALESTLSADSDRRRVRDQARFFGVADPRSVAGFGRQATERTRELLADGFTVHTARARAPGRSKRPRIYAMVTLSDGRDLAAVLVSEGLARARGVARARPDGTRGEEYATQLQDLELAAALERKGLWALTDPTRLADLRKAQRDEQDSLRQAFGVFGTLSEETPLDLNTASAEDLQQLKGIGPVLAERIIAQRPFARVEDLDGVPGIGPAIMDTARPFVSVGE